MLRKATVYVTYLILKGVICIILAYSEIAVKLCTVHHPFDSLGDHK